MVSKTVLIVYAHHEPKSFNAALKDVAMETLRGQGHHVLLTDLYDMKFNPTAPMHDYPGKSMYSRGVGVIMVLLVHLSSVLQFYTGACINLHLPLSLLCVC